MTDSKRPQKKAVALVYDRQTGSAPKVVASGANLIAERIIAAAASAGVHIQEDKALVELLAKIPVGQEIPAELYQTIAEILAFVYSVNNRYKKTVGSTPDHRPNN